MIGVLVSGEGTNLQALIDAGLPVVAVACNRHGAPRARRARAAGIADRVFERATHETARSGTSRWRVARENGVQLVVLAGYMHL